MIKKCPFCAEQIQAEAIKCRHCGERLDVHDNQAPDNSGKAAKGDFGVYSAVAVIFGVVGFFFFPIILGPIGIICGAMGSSRKESGGLLGIAVSAIGMVGGMVFGYLAIMSSQR